MGTYKNSGEHKGTLPTCSAASSLAWPREPQLILFQIPKQRHDLLDQGSPMPTFSSSSMRKGSRLRSPEVPRVRQMRTPVQGTGGAVQAEASSWFTECCYQRGVTAAKGQHAHLLPPSSCCPSPQT
jgi:hypothetical protein